MIKQYTKNNKKLYMINNLYLGVNPITGKEVRKSKRGFESKREAEIYIARLKVEFEKGTMFVSNKKHTFSDIYDLWIENHKYTVKESTYKRIISVSKTILQYFANADIKKVTMLDCQKIVNIWGKKYSLKYLTSLMVYTSAVFEYAITSNLLNSNPMKKVKKPKIEKEKIKEEELYYSKEELTKFLELVKNTSDNRDYIFFRLLAYTGARIGEILALEWSDINFNNSTISINKTLAQGLNNKIIVQTPKTKNSDRVIDIDLTTMQILRQYKLEQKEILFKLGWQNKGILFPSKKNTYFHPTSFNFRLSNICKIHNFKKIKIHGFRHTHCSLLFESEATIQEVQYRLGHSDIKTTMNIYNHVTEKMKQQTANKFAEYMSI